MRRGVVLAGVGVLAGLTWFGPTAGAVPKNQGVGSGVAAAVNGLPGKGFHPPADYDEELHFYIKGNVPAQVTNISAFVTAQDRQCVDPHPPTSVDFTPGHAPSEVVTTYSVRNTGFDGQPPVSCVTNPSFATAIIDFSNGKEFEHYVSYGQASVYIYKNGSTFFLKCTGTSGIVAGCSTWSYDQSTITLGP